MYNYNLDHQPKDLTKDLNHLLDLYEEIETSTKQHQEKIELLFENQNHIINELKQLTKQINNHQRTHHQKEPQQ